MKKRGKGRAERMKRAQFHLTESQRDWLKSRPEGQSTLVRTAVDILKNWFEIDQVSGNVTPKSVVACLLSGRILADEIKRRAAASEELKSRDCE